jgi:mycothiol synthase
MPSAKSAAIVVRPLDPATATAADLDACVEVALAAARVDRPDEPAPAPAAVRQRLTRTPLPGRRYLAWVATDGADLTGVATLVLEGTQPAGLAAVSITVRPDRRRRGTATALLRELTAAAAGRKSLFAEGVVDGSAGQAAAAAWGFAIGQRTLDLSLDLATADRPRWRVPDVAGYRLVTWTGAAPAGLLSSYAAARNAIREAPHGDLSFDEPEWTPDRVRAEEATAQARGCTVLVAVAVAETTGEVAGLTYLEIYQTRPDLAVQQDTAVRPGHRGHGLGVWLKSANLRRLADGYPAVGRVSTSNAADNAHMLRVNAAVGFAVRQRTEIRTAAVSGLAARLRP